MFPVSNFFKRQFCLAYSPLKQLFICSVTRNQILCFWLRKRNNLSSFSRNKMWREQTWSVFGCCLSNYAPNETITKIIQRVSVGDPIRQVENFLPCLHLLLYPNGNEWVWGDDRTHFKEYFWDVISIIANPRHLSCFSIKFSTFHPFSTVRFCHLVFVRSGSETVARYASPLLPWIFRAVEALKLATGSYVTKGSSHTIIYLKSRETGHLPFRWLSFDAS